jgi:hypothetical protein
MSLAITPKDAASKLVIDVVANGAGTGSSIVLGLFQDSTADALAAVAVQAPNVSGAFNRSAQIVLRHVMTAGTTAATTFKVRIGLSGSGTFTFNGVSGSRMLGGGMASSITIREIMP